MPPKNNKINLNSEIKKYHSKGIFKYISTIGDQNSHRALDSLKAQLLNIPRLSPVIVCL